MFLAQEEWDKATILAWKLRLLRLAFPRREVVRFRGRTFLIR